jgi:hypothetical protein
VQAGTGAFLATVPGRLLAQGLAGSLRITTTR